MKPVSYQFHILTQFFFLVGAAIVGRISDSTVIKWRKKRGGVWYPEDRLRASLLPFAVIIPLSLLVFGLVNRFIDGPLGLFLSLICLFFNGLGVSFFFSLNNAVWGVIEKPYFFLQRWTWGSVLVLHTLSM